MKKVFAVILIISISLFALSFSIQIHSYSIDSYMENYEKNNLEERTGKSRDEYKAISQDIIDYLKGGNIKLMERNFNKKEVMHMEDVQKLYTLNNAIKWTSLIVILLTSIYLIMTKKVLLIKKVFKGLFINYFLMVLLAILIKLDFNKYFIYFHLIFFDNDLWILDVNRDLLLQMMPENFFFTMATKIGLTFILIILLAQLFLYLIEKYILNKKRYI